MHLPRTQRSGSTSADGAANVIPFVSSVDRIPPNNLEAEMALLGSIMVDREMMAVALEIVTATDFYAALHETTFAALCALYERDEPLDKVALAEELKNRGMLDKVGGMAYLNSLMDTVPTAASAEYYARIVREKSVLRGIIAAGTQVAQIGYELEYDVPVAIERTARIFRDLDDRVRDDDDGWKGRSAADIAAHGVDAVAWDIEGLIARDDGPVLLYGQPGAGKSWIALHMLVCVTTGEKFAGRFRVPARRPRGLYVNLDAGAKAMDRRVADVLRVDHPAVVIISPGSWSPRAFDRLLEQNRGAFVVLDAHGDVFHPDPNQEQGEAARAFWRDLRRLFARHDANGIVVDHANRSGTFYGSNQKLATVRQMISVEAVNDGPPDPRHIRARLSSEKMSEGEKFAPIDLALDFADDGLMITVTGSFGPPETSRDRLLAKIDAGDPVTREELGATGGKTKTDFDGLLREGTIMKTGRKYGRRDLYWTPDRITQNPFTGLAENPTRTETRDERDNGAGLNRAKAENPAQPDTPTPPSATAPRDLGSVATGGRENEPGSGLVPKENPVRQPGSSAPSDRVA